MKFSLLILAATGMAMGNHLAAKKAGAAKAKTSSAAAAAAKASNAAGTAGTAGTAAAAGAASNGTAAAAGTAGVAAAAGGAGVTVQTSQQGTPVQQLGVGGGQAGGALNAGASGAPGPNGLPQLANPQAGFNPATNQGTFGPFQPVSAALAVATGAPTTVDAATAQALQAAADNWSFDTAQVSNFLNTGKSLAANQFNAGANIGYNAEVDELTHKAILDSVIGNSPDVSIANQTLTNGVFQSVVNNLQVMAVQGANTQQLIDAINSVRCTQILPSIDTYMQVAANVIGAGATLRTAIRPDACQAIVAAAPSTAFPGNINVLNVRSNANRVTSQAPAANPNQGTVAANLNLTPNVQTPASGGAAAAAPAAGGAGTAASGTTPGTAASNAPAAKASNAAGTAAGATKGGKGGKTTKGNNNRRRVKFSA